MWDRFTAQAHVLAAEGAKVIVGDVWSMVHAERVALIDDLGDLADARWDEQSLCREWTVHNVVAHLVDSA